MYSDRISLYKALEKSYGTKILTYFTSDRIGMGAQIATDVIDLFINHLDRMGVVKKLTLYLYTRGGDIAAAWNIVNLLRMYCDKLQIIVPHKAHSAGTIICLGADEIVMTKQATLGPIDPSVNSAFNPVGMGTGINMPVSVEAINGYIEYAKNELGISDESMLTQIYLKLAEKVHPLVLGQAHRSRGQIQMLAKKLLKSHIHSDKKINKIVEFLCSESGSHDYTINRREAKEDLELKVMVPSEKQYAIIKEIYDNISDELELMKPFNADEMEGEYSCKRCLLESVSGGVDIFVTNGIIQQNVPCPSGNSNLVGIQNNVLYNGWHHDEHESIGKTKKILVKKGVEYVATQEYEI